MGREAVVKARDEGHSEDPGETVALRSRESEEPAISRQGVEALLADHALRGFDMQVVPRDVPPA